MYPLKKLFCSPMDSIPKNWQNPNDPPPICSLSPFYSCFRQSNKIDEVLFLLVQNLAWKMTGLKMSAKVHFKTNIFHLKSKSKKSFPTFWSFAFCLASTSESEKRKKERNVIPQKIGIFQLTMLKSTVWLLHCKDPLNES